MMNEGQEKFLAFFLANTKESEQNQAKQLLLESFKAQEDHKLTRAEFTDLQNNLLPLLQPDKVEDVKKAMAHFSAQL